MKRVISMSLWGSEKRYTYGAVRNARLALIHYPDWTCRFYVPEDYKDPCVADLIEMPNVELMTFKEGVPPMMQRFLVADDVSVERFIVRDADSRLSEREALAVEEWIVEDKCGHVMRDHAAHQAMPGGLWGAMWRRSNWEAPKMEGLIAHFLANQKSDPEAYQTDQNFLVYHVWPWLCQSMTIHDSSIGRRKEIGGKPFPKPRNPWPRFCGEVVMINPETGADCYREGDVMQIPKDNE